MAKLSFKVYLVNDDLSEHVEQVRRFGIDSDVAMNYNYLREKLQIFFPELRCRNFIITWRDEEKENITISTNEELEIALAEMSKDHIPQIYKLYIILQNDHEKDTSAEAKKTEKNWHPGVICDMCDKEIYGFRFKCMQCKDYDLCFDCMKLGCHPEHYMVRMTNPVDWSSYHGHRLNHHMRKFVRRMMYSSKDDERKAKGGKRGGSGTRGCPMFNATGDVCDEQKRSPKEQQHRDPSTEAATEATESPQQEVTKDKFSQLMKMLEDNFSSISQFLDPLGISVSVVDDRDANKQSKPAASKNGAQEKAAEGQNADETVRESKKFPGKGKKLCDDSTEEKAGSPDNAMAKDTAAASCSAEQAAEADEWTMLQCDSAMNVSRASSASSSSSGAIPKQGASSTPTAPPPAEPAKAEPPKSMYPPLPQEVKHDFYHPNPKIQNAVETMMSMGFSNDGGWLTHLLVSKNGDICQALDVLSAVPRSK